MVPFVLPIADHAQSASVEMAAAQIRPPKTVGSTVLMTIAGMFFAIQASVYLSCAARAKLPPELIIAPRTVAIFHMISLHV